MNYLEAHLGPGERVAYRARIHPFILAQPVVILLLGIIYCRTSIGANHFLGVCLLVVGGVSMLQRVFIVAGSVFVVTNLRLVFKTGVLRRTAREIMLEKADGILVEQSVAGRLFGYGSIVVTTAGNMNSYAYVAAPMRFKRAINARIEESLHRTRAGLPGHND